MSIATAASSFSVIDKSLSRKETQFLRNSTYNLWFSSVACLETAASYLPNYRLSHERHLTVKLRDKTTTTRLSDFFFFSSSSTTFDSLFESSWLTTSAMVSLLLTTRKIISSSFTHWPRMAFKWPQMIMLRTEFAVQSGTFFLPKVAKTISTLFYLCQTDKNDTFLCVAETWTSDTNEAVKTSDLYLPLRYFFQSGRCVTLLSIIYKLSKSAASHF